MDEMHSHVEKIHNTPHKSVVAVSGAGTQAVAWLLGVAGASRTVLEAVSYTHLTLPTICSV